MWARVAHPISAMKTGINGQCHHHDDGRDPVGAHHRDQDGERDDDGQEELREVASEVAVEGVDAADGKSGQLTGPLDRSAVRSR